MLGSLETAVSGLDVYQEDMNVIGNNIANVNTDGYKDATANLGTSFSNSLDAASGGGSPLEIGTGVNIESTSNNWTTGTLNSTGYSNDLGIQGSGFFLVTDYSTGSAGQTYATQVGNFTADSNGYLVVQNTELRVQGIPAGGTTVGNLQLPTTGITGYNVDSYGNVTATLANGSTQAVGQIMLQNYLNPQALTPEANNLYSNLSAAGGLAAPAAPGSSGTGNLVSGTLEASNVDLSSEMANLIVAQRGFEANSKMVTASDEILQTVVNMVR